MTERTDPALRAPPGSVAPGALRLAGLTLGYDRHPAVHHLDGTIPAGDMLALVGPNGAGKSTLLKGLVGEIPCLDGQVLRGVPREAVAYLPQADEIDRSFPLSVLDLASMGLWHRAGPWRSLRGTQRPVLAALAAVGLTGFEERPIGTLSGGQFQRALFARLILQDAAVILLDEPFTGIDARTVADLLVLMHGWHAQGRTVVAALHDFDQVRTHFPSTLLLAREPVAWGPTARVLTPANLARAARLSEAWDETAAVCARDHAGPDDEPAPGGLDHLGDRQADHHGHAGAGRHGQDPHAHDHHGHAHAHHPHGGTA